MASSDPYNDFALPSLTFFTDSPALTQAVGHTAAVYQEVGQLYEEQPRYDWERFNDLLHEYRGMLTSFPDMFNMHKVGHDG